MNFPFSVPRSGHYKITFKGKVNGFIGAGRSSGIGHCAHSLKVGAGIYNKGLVQDILRDTLDEDWPTGIKWFTTTATIKILQVLFPTGWVSVVIEAADVAITIADIVDQLDNVALYSNESIGGSGLVMYAELEAGQEYEMAFFVNSLNVGAISAGILTSIIDVDASLEEVLLEEQPTGTIGPIIQVEPEGIVDMGATLVSEPVTVQSAFVVKNIGDQVLTGQLSITPGPFEIMTGTNYGLAPEEELNVSIRFLSQGSGTYQRKLVFTG
ncbi:unnamed protein product, partial [marine sediment metagenome]